MAAALDTSTPDVPSTETPGTGSLTPRLLHLGQPVVRALPYWSALTPEGWDPIDADAQFDRIPKGEIEVRRQSVVKTSDGHSVGHVEGMVADAEHMVAVVVTTGVPGIRHHVVVPVASVDLVGADEVLLSIDRKEFHDLPDTSGLRPPTTEAAHQAAGRTKRKISKVAAKASSTVRHLDQRRDSRRLRSPRSPRSR